MADVSIPQAEAGKKELRLMKVFRMQFDSTPQDTGHTVSE